MEQILEPNEQFIFDRLALSAPIFINSGNYFIKYLYDNSPLYIQAPKCITKQGILKGGKKLYCDCLFTNENASFIRWIEDLENYSQKYIYENRTKWFENNLEMHDIENSFTSPLKVYKSGKYYIIRTSIPTRLGKCILKIYDENEMDVDPDTIQDGTNIISIWEIQGIKCSSKNFQIDIEVKQMMVIKPSKLFEKCLIHSKKLGGVSGSEDTMNDSLGKMNENSFLENQTNKNVATGTTNDTQPDSSTVLSLSDTGINLPTEVFEDIKVSDVTEDNVPSTESTRLMELDCDVPIHQNEDINNIQPIRELYEPQSNLHDIMEYAESGEEDNNYDSEHEEESEDGSQINVLEIEDEEGENDPQISILDKSLEIVDLDNHVLENDIEATPIELKNRNDVYYEIYMEAKKKAIDSRNLAILSFLEAKKIKDLDKIKQYLE